MFDDVYVCVYAVDIQAYLRDIEGFISDHHNKVSKAHHTFFLFTSASKSYVYTILQSIKVCNCNK